VKLAQTPTSLLEETGLKQSQLAADIISINASILSKGLAAYRLIVDQTEYYATADEISQKLAAGLAMLAVKSQILDQEASHETLIKLLVEDLQVKQLAGQDMRETIQNTLNAIAEADTDWLNEQAQTDYAKELLLAAERKTNDLAIATKQNEVEEERRKVAETLTDADVTAAEEMADARVESTLA